MSLPLDAAHFCIANIESTGWRGGGGEGGIGRPGLSLPRVRLSTALNESGCRGRLVENAAGIP